MTLANTHWDKIFFYSHHERITKCMCVYEGIFSATEDDHSSLLYSELIQLQPLSKLRCWERG